MCRTCPHSGRQCPIDKELEAEGVDHIRIDGYKTDQGSDWTVDIDGLTAEGHARGASMVDAFAAAKENEGEEHW